MADNYKPNWMSPKQPTRRRRLAVGQAHADMQAAMDSTPDIMEV